MAVGAASLAAGGDTSISARQHSSQRSPGMGGLGGVLKPLQENREWGLPKEPTEVPLLWVCGRGRKRGTSRGHARKIVVKCFASPGDAGGCVAPPPCVPPGRLAPIPDPRLVIPATELRPWLVRAGLPGEWQVSSSLISASWGCFQLGPQQGP